ncbi:hypothetical protein DZ956_022205 [Pseudomonas aeruginosa]|uniref:hypothetical protein n=1 Tax=Pseudomonas aeruginosa TaxID=287 RepID=UPI0015C57A77|nr:hypothetical protein [Pseudomonas aeruginosa]NPZ19491.1 hypothetical protein [Pseudomonas aeruginosa]
MSQKSSQTEQLLGMLFMAALAAGAGLLLVARIIAQWLTEDGSTQEGAAHDDSN